MSDLFKDELPTIDGEEEKTLIHKKKAKFDALKERQKKLKEKMKKKKNESEGDTRKNTDEDSADDSEDEYVGFSLL